jgi:HEAT repeat protein
LVEELHAAGYPVSAVWELTESGRPYSSAIPILLEHLQRDYPGQVRDRIARALAIPEASYGWPVLVEQYRAEHDNLNGKQGLAVALAELVTEERLDEYLELVHDARHGESRGLLLLGLQRLSRRKHSRARDAYVALADDPVLGPEVRRVLRRRKPGREAK